MERSFRLIGKASLFTFRDAIIKAALNATNGKRLDVRCSALVSIQLDDCTVLQNSEETEDGSTWIISFELEGGKLFEVAKGSREPPQASFPQFHVSENDVPLWKRRVDVQRMKCIRFILPHYQDCGAFRPHLAKAILLRELDEQSPQSYKDFIALAPASSSNDWNALIRPHLEQVRQLGGDVRSWALNTLRPILEAGWARAPDTVPLEMLSVADSCPVPLTVKQLLNIQDYFRLTWLRDQEQKRLERT